MDCICGKREMLRMDPRFLAQGGRWRELPLGEIGMSKRGS